MTGEPAGGRIAVLVVEGDDELRERLAGDVRTLVGRHADVIAVAGGDGALAAGRAAAAAGDEVAVAFVERMLPEGSGADLVLAMHDDELLGRTRCVLITRATSLTKVDAALNRGAVHGMLRRPWSPAALRDQLRAQLATYLVEHAPEHLDDYPGLISDPDLARARQRIAEQRGASGEVRPTARHILLAPQYDERDVVDLLVAALDQTLGHPPRLRVAAGSVLLEQGTDVGGIYLILDGEVELRRHTESGTQVVHSDATGPIVGLLSLASRQRAFLEVRAVTELRALPVTLGQLERAVAAESDVGPLLTRTLVNALANRLRDAEEFQLRIDALNDELAAERDQLATALDELERAQARLIEQARMATLGELAAGIAHELNNPAAALARAAEHVRADVGRLLDDDEVVARLEAAATAAPMPSAVRRAARRELTDALGNRTIAERLVDAGVTDVAAATRLAHDRAALDRLTAAHQLGGQLRNVVTAAGRITELVDSLRAYLRGGADDPAVAEVDVAASVEDAIGLLGHRLHDVTVDRRYDDVPPIVGRPGRLQQLWTNLIANAIDAAGAGGTIGVTVDRPARDAVRVRITDDGPGIDPELRDQLFHPRFTTKHGRVTFGSGLGLTICRQITDDHDGTIDLASDSGVTTATVMLPIATRGGASTVTPEEDRR